MPRREARGSVARRAVRERTNIADELISIARTDRAPNGARDRARVAVLAAAAGTAATTGAHAAAQTATTATKIGAVTIGAGILAVWARSAS